MHLTKETMFLHYKQKNIFSLARTRTWNLLLRRQTPYPLGHERPRRCERGLWRSWQFGIYIDATILRNLCVSATFSLKAMQQELMKQQQSIMYPGVKAAMPYNTLGHLKKDISKPNL